MSMLEPHRRRALALRAFPPRWRDRHGDELAHVSGELASSSDQDADLREFVDLVRGGLSVRLHDRPPFGVRAGYRWIERPVPLRWYAWMRDDLRGRWLGVRRGVRGVLPVLLVVLVINGFPTAQALINGGVCLAIVLGCAPFQARRARKRMNAKVGFDIVCSQLPPPVRLLAPTAIETSVVRRPATRMAYVRLATPLAAWSMLSGAALLVGAGFSNTSNRSVGPLTYSPDPNSPLPVDQVTAIVVAVSVAVVALAMAIAVVTGRRVRQLSATTVHECRSPSARPVWAIVSVFGLMGAAIGLLGAPPDLACAVIGAVLIIAGAVAGSAAFVVRLGERRLGRHISLAELLVGERDPARAPVPAPARH